MAELCDCVIVGGGIGGAVLALALGRRGHRVIVLEWELHPPLAARPEVLAGSTVEAFRRLGVETQLLRDAVLPLRRLELWRSGGGRMLELTEDDFRRVGAQPYSTDPAKTRHLLLEAAISTRNVELHRGVEVRTLVREGSQLITVHGQRDHEPVAWRGRLVVGDDGTRSRIRVALGIPLELSEFALEFLVAAGPALPDAAEDVGQAWADPSALQGGIVLGVFMPLPGARTAMALLASPSTCERLLHAPPSAFYEAATRLSPRCQALAEGYRFPDDFAHIRRPFGHAARYVDDAAALIGDAAHPVTPAGGQGANMSVADALALADVVQQALSLNDCSRSRLEPYEAIRRSANERSLQFSVRTDRVFRTLQQHPWMAALLPISLAFVNRSQTLKARLIRAVS